MPAYFNMSLVFERKDIYSEFTRDVNNLLQKAGLKFKSGYYGAEKYSLEEILSWNQTHLENNFQLAFEEHYSHGYKQMLFVYGEFSEVRGFWMNNYPEEDEITLEIIIPEDDIIEYDGCGKYGYFYKVKEIQMLINASKILWNNKLVKSIQTGLEISDEVISINRLRAGKMPNMHPFAIVSDEFEEQLREAGVCVEKIEGMEYWYRKKTNFRSIKINSVCFECINNTNKFFVERKCQKNGIVEI